MKSFVAIVIMAIVAVSMAEPKAEAGPGLFHTSYVQNAGGIHYPLSYYPYYGGNAYSYYPYYGYGYSYPSVQSYSSYVPEPVVTSAVHQVHHGVVV